MSRSRLINTSSSSSSNSSVVSSAFLNPNALALAAQKLIVANQVTAVILEGDSMMFGNTASSIATTHRVKFRQKLQDKLNAHFGGCKKSGMGRFGPFYPYNTLSDVTGPVIMPTGSGWVPFAAGHVVDWTSNLPYWTEMVRATLRHPGSITPAVGNHYAGCYVLFNPACPDPGPAKWVSILFNASLTGTFRVKGIQGASITVRGATGTDRYMMPAGAFGGSDVPNPASNTDVVFDVTINPSNYVQSIGAITDHLNATPMDPTQVWALCIYRVDNAATTVEINGFDAHYDEYTAQNTPRSDGAVTVMNFAWPGDTDQGEQSGNAIYGANSENYQQDVPFRHMGLHSEAYIHPLYRHHMPLAKLAIFNEWRNTLNSVDSINPAVSPTIFQNRLANKVQMYGQAGIASLYLWDMGSSPSYICSGPYYGAVLAGSFDTSDYRTALLNALDACNKTKGLSSLGGGLTVLDLSLVFGRGGPETYAKESMVSTLDGLHWNDNGYDRIAACLVAACAGNTSIPKKFPNLTPTWSRKLVGTITKRAGLSKYNTVLSYDVDDYASLRISSGGGGIMPEADYQSFAAYGFYDGVNTTQTPNTIRGTDASKLLARGFGDRAGLFINNKANKNNRIVIDISSLAINLPKFTIAVAIQNLWENGMGSFPGNIGSYLQFGVATDDAKTSTTIYDTWSSGSVILGSAQGLNGGTPFSWFGNVTSGAVCYVGDHPNPGHQPAMDPYIAIISVDCVAKTVSTYINPSQNEKTTTLGAAFPASWAPTRLSIGGSLGTGAWCMPQLFGGVWVIDGALTNSEKTALWKQIQAESGNRFQMGSSFSDYGSMKTPA